MNNLTRLATTGVTLSFVLLGGCATGHIDPADRDTTGTYDGEWIGAVDEPRASRETLPGNWIMNCEWKPFEFLLSVNDGQAQLGNLENKTPVSRKGDFRIDLINSEADMRGGVMPGNPRIVQVFSGNLAGDEPHGKYAQFITSVGSNGCNAKVRLRRNDNPVS